MTNDIATSMIGKYCIIRTYSAGVHAGTLKARNEKEVVLTDSRRLWYWSGAASISELASRGTSDHNKCKFPGPTEEILLTEVIEILPCSAPAEMSIRNVPIWTA